VAGHVSPSSGSLPVADAQAQPGELIVNILTGAMCVRTIQPTCEAPAEEAHDAGDRVRMDDDGGWQMPIGVVFSNTMPPRPTLVTREVTRCEVLTHARSHRAL
jgi:hypothetical protein